YALKLGLESDVVITGAAPNIFTDERLKQNKLTFRYGERIFKVSPYAKFNPRILKMLYLNYTRYRNKNLFMLCNGAFVHQDLRWAKIKPEKMYKWGYFTKVTPLHAAKVLENKRQAKIKLLFVARLIPLKHPDMLIDLGEMLKAKGYDFEINIIGTGEMETELKRSTTERQLEHNIHFLGNLPNNRVLEEMQSNNALIFTSDRNEGWGAVINEAMSNACTVVASHIVGSIPFLIQHGKSGLVFKSGDIKDLFKKVEQLILNRASAEQMALQAYHDISSIWSPQNAANNFLKLAESKLNNCKSTIIQGPCTEAEYFPENWFDKISD
ncbi:MAG: glycosyltransferase, partial [Flavobacteriaceae bacterium]